MSGVLERLREVNQRRCEVAFGHTINSWSVLEWAGAAAGEMGETCNIAKKMIRHRDKVRGNKGPDTSLEFLKSKLANEIADTVIYLDLLALHQDIDLAAAIAEAFNNKSKELRSTIFI